MYRAAGQLEWSSVGCIPNGPKASSRTVQKTLATKLRGIGIGQIFISPISSLIGGDGS